MAVMQNFRSALGGFNREDVVRYIEYMNHQHNSEVEQLNTQLQTAKEALAQAQSQSAGELQTRLEEALAKCAALEEKLAAGQVGQPAGSELEAYRRAERAERMAQERADRIYEKANAVLAEATEKVEAAAQDMDAVVEELSARMASSKAQLQNAVAAMYAIRPEEK